MATVTDQPSHDVSGHQSSIDTRTPTTAVLAPYITTSASALPRSTILHHHKTPLLLATPPQITRALAHSHHIIAPMNYLAGLVSWTTNDRWESFLLLSLFWFTTLYIDRALQYCGPVVFVFFLSAALYLRRYSPLSSTSWSRKDATAASSPLAAHHKSLDDIVGTLHTFTTRCNILLDPLLFLTDFLSTQQTPTTATTRPALRALFFRLFLALPLWILLTFSPVRLITFRRITLIVGTLILTWHSPPASITRLILWRSKSVRYVFAFLTGLNFSPTKSAVPAPHEIGASASTIALAKSTTDRANGIVSFTFAVYENQRRWLGLGWTSNLFAYERSPWTDEYLNPVPDPQHFELPSVEGSAAKWRWAEASVWHVEGHKSSTASDASNAASEMAWVYHDNKWRDPVRGQDSWSKYTRRRKWVRDAELVDPDDASHRSETAATAEHDHKTASLPTMSNTAAQEPVMVTGAQVFGTTSSSSQTKLRKSWFGGASNRSDSSSPQPKQKATDTLHGDQPLKRQDSNRSNVSKKSSKQAHARSPSSISAAGSTESLTNNSIKSTKSKEVDNRQKQQRRLRAVDDDNDNDKGVSERSRDLAWGLNDELSMALG